MIENSTIRKFIIKGGDVNRSFLLKDVLVEFQGLLWAEGAKYNWAPSARFVG